VGRLARRHRDVLLLVALCTVTCGPFLGGPFIYDDFAIIAGNPHLRDIGRIGQFFTPHYWNAVHVGTRGVFRPLREVVFTLIAHVFGPQPLAFHAVSFGLHMLVCLLVYALGRRVLRDNLAAFLGAALFAVHPVHLEAVLWAKNLAEVMAAAFVLGAFLLYLRALRADTSSASRAGWGVAATALYAAALLCKESGLGLAGVLLLYALSRPRAERRRALALAAPVVLLGLAYVAFQFAASDLVTAAVEGQRADPDEALWLRPALVGKTYAFYLIVLLLPVQLCAQYHFTFPISYLGGEALPWLLVLAAVLAGAALAFRKWPRAAWLLAWPFVFLGPVSNVIPFKGRPVGDQRLYVPSIGFCLLAGVAAAAAWRLSRAWRERRIVRTALGGAFGCLLLLALARGPVWTDTNRFWFDLFRKSYLQSQANHFLAKAYLSAGLPLAALVHADYCIQGAQGRLMPMHVEAMVLLGEANAALGEPLEAKRQFLRALDLRPDLPRALVGLGGVHLALQEYDAAAAAFGRALRVGDKPRAAYVGLALAYQGRGEFGRSLAPLRRAVALDPEDPFAHRLLARALEALGDRAGAEREARAAEALERRRR